MTCVKLLVILGLHWHSPRFIATPQETEFMFMWEEMGKLSCMEYHGLTFAVRALYLALDSAWCVWINVFCQKRRKLSLCEPPLAMSISGLLGVSWSFALLAWAPTRLVDAMVCFVFWRSCWITRLRAINRWWTITMLSIFVIRVWILILQPGWIRIKRLCGT